MNILLMQIPLQWENPSANRQYIESQLADYQEEKDIVLIPEMFTTGFSMEAEKNAETMQGESVKWLEALAKTHNCLIVGSLIITENGQYYNRLLAFSPEGLLAKYDKRHLFRMAGEHSHYAAGTEKAIFHYKGWKIRPLICYDLRFPVWSRNVEQEYDLLLYVANWPERRVAHWNALLKARAIENQCFVAAVNRVGTDANNIIYSGDSAIIDPLGNVLAHNSGEEKLLSAHLDKEAMETYRKNFPAWIDADNFQIAIE